MERRDVQNVRIKSEAYDTGGGRLADNRNASDASGSQNFTSECRPSSKHPLKPEPNTSSVDFEFALHIQPHERVTTGIHGDSDKTSGIHGNAGGLAESLHENRNTGHGAPGTSAGLVGPPPVGNIAESPQEARPGPSDTSTSSHVAQEGRDTVRADQINERTRYASDADVSLTVFGDGAAPVYQLSPWRNSPSWTTSEIKGFRTEKEPSVKPALPLIIFRPISTQPYIIDDVTDYVSYEETKWLHYSSLPATRGRDEEDAGEERRDLEDMDVSSSEEEEGEERAGAGAGVAQQPESGVESDYLSETDQDNPPNIALPPPVRPPATNTGESRLAPSAAAGASLPPLNRADTEIISHQGSAPRENIPTTSTSTGDNSVINIEGANQVRVKQEADDIQLSEQSRANRRLIRDYIDLVTDSEPEEETDSDSSGSSDGMDSDDESQPGATADTQDISLNDDDVIFINNSSDEDEGSKDQEVRNYCPLCSDKPSVPSLPSMNMFDLRQHIQARHFPWYLALSSYHKGDNNHHTTLSRRFYPALYISIGDRCQPPQEFMKMWGKLIHELLCYISDNLGVISVHELVEKVVCDKLCPDAKFDSFVSKDLQHEDEMCVQAYQTYYYTKCEKKDSTFTNPEVESDLLHWVTLTNLLCKLPIQSRSDILTCDPCCASKLYSPLGSEPDERQDYPSQFWDAIDEPNIRLLLDIVNAAPHVLSLFKEGTRNRALNYCLSEKKYQIATALLFAGVNVDEQDRLGWTALRCAVKDSDLTSVKLLLAWGAKKKKNILKACKKALGSELQSTIANFVPINSSVLPFKPLPGSTCAASFVRSPDPTTVAAESSDLPLQPTGPDVNSEDKPGSVLNTPLSSSPISPKSESLALKAEAVQPKTEVSESRSNRAALEDDLFGEESPLPVINLVPDASELAGRSLSSSVIEILSSPGSPGSLPSSPGSLRINAATPEIDPVSSDVDPANSGVDPVACPRREPTSPMLDSASPVRETSQPSRDPASPRLDPASPGEDSTEPEADIHDEDISKVLKTIDRIDSSTDVDSPALNTSASSPDKTVSSVSFSSMENPQSPETSSSTAADSTSESLHPEPRIRLNRKMTSDSDKGFRSHSNSRKHKEAQSHSSSSNNNNNRKDKELRSHGTSSKDKEGRSHGRTHSTHSLDTDSLPEQCKVCLDRFHNEFECRKHFINKHLPWYFRVITFDPDEEIQTDICRKLLPALKLYLQEEPLNEPMEYFSTLWGCLLHSFLDRLSNLKNHTHISGLLKHEQKHYGDDTRRKRAPKDEIAMMTCHYRYFKDRQKKGEFTVTPPECISSLMHWKTLMKLISRIPEAEQKNLSTFEKHIDMTSLLAYIGKRYRKCNVVGHMTTSMSFMKDAFLKAMEKDDAAKMWGFIRDDNDLITNQVNREFSNPLQYCVSLKRPRAAQILLFSGAMVNVPDSTGDTPLRRAARKGNRSGVLTMLPWVNRKDIQEALAVATERKKELVIDEIESYLKNLDKSSAKPTPENNSSRIKKASKRKHILSTSESDICEARTSKKRTKFSKKKDVKRKIEEPDLFSSPESVTVPVSRRPVISSSTDSSDTSTSVSSNHSDAKHSKPSKPQKKGTVIKGVGSFIHEGKPPRQKQQQRRAIMLDDLPLPRRPTSGKTTNPKSTTYVNTKPNDAPISRPSSSHSVAKKKSDSIDCIKRSADLAQSLFSDNEAGPESKAETSDSEEKMETEESAPGLNEGSHVATESVESVAIRSMEVTSASPEGAPARENSMSPKESTSPNHSEEHLQTTKVTPTKSDAGAAIQDKHSVRSRVSPTATSDRNRVTSAARSRLALLRDVQTRKEKLPMRLKTTTVTDVDMGGSGKDTQPSTVCSFLTSKNSVSSDLPKSSAEYSPRDTSGDSDKSSLSSPSEGNKEKLNPFQLSPADPESRSLWDLLDKELPPVHRVPFARARQASGEGNLSTVSMDTTTTASDLSLGSPSKIVPVSHVSPVQDRTGPSLSPHQTPCKPGDKPTKAGSPGTPENVCPVCNIKGDRNMLMLHVYDTHLPWYFSIHIAREHPGYRHTRLKKQLDPIIYKIHVCDEKHQQLIQKILGCMMYHFLRKIMEYLALEGDMEELLKYVKNKKLHMKHESSMSFEAKFPIVSLRAFVPSYGSSTFTVAPPSGIASLAHWWILSKLLFRVGPNAQEELLSYEKLTAGSVLRRIGSVMPYTPSADKEVKQKIHEAVVDRKFSDLWQLLQNNPGKARLNVDDPKESPFISYALGGNNFEGATALLLFGADVNQTNKFGETPLKLAVQHRNATLVSFLKIWGPLKQLDEAIELARKKGDHKILDILIKYKQKCKGEKVQQRSKSLDQPGTTSTGRNPYQYILTKAASLDRGRAKATSPHYHGNAAAFVTSPALSTMSTPDSHYNFSGDSAVATTTCSVCHQHVPIQEYITHAGVTHLPWYISVNCSGLPEQAVSLIKKTQLATMLCEDLYKSAQRTESLPQCVIQIWGKLVHGFMSYLGSRLGLQDHGRILEHVLANRLWEHVEGRGTILWEKPRLFVDVYQAYTGDTFREVTLSPPNHPAGLLHPVTLLALITQLPREEQDQLPRVESFSWDKHHAYLPSFTGPVPQPRVGKEISKNVQQDFICALMDVNQCKVERLLQEYPNLVLERSQDEGKGVVACALAMAGMDQAALSIAQILLLSGADIDLADSIGNTALHDALKHKHLIATKFLLTWGADVDKLNAAGDNAYALAFRSDDLLLAALNQSQEGFLQPIPSELEFGDEQEMDTAETPDIEKTPLCALSSPMTSPTVSQLKAPGKQLLCPICKKPNRDWSVLQEHVCTVHLPWYVGLSYTAKRQTSWSKLSHKLLLVLGNLDGRGRLDLHDCFKLCLGRLLAGFLLKCATILKLHTVRDLVNYVNTFNMYPKDVKYADLPAHDKVLIDSHCYYCLLDSESGTGRISTSISPPKGKSGLIHWYTLAHIVAKLPKEHRMNMGLYEKYTHKNLFHLEEMKNKDARIDLETTRYALWEAITAGNLDKVWRNLTYFPRLVNESLDRSGSTPLHVAIRNNKIQVATFLLLCQAAVDKRDAKGNTPLYIATKDGHKDGVVLLTYWNARKQLSEALELASMHGYNKICAVLMNAAESDFKKNISSESKIPVNRSIDEHGVICTLCTEPKVVPNIRIHTIEHHLPWFLSVVRVCPDIMRGNNTQLALQLGPSIHNSLSSKKTPYQAIYKIWGKLILGFLKIITTKLGLASVGFLLEYVKEKRLHPDKNRDTQEGQAWGKALLKYHNCWSTLSPHAPVTLADVLHWRTLHNLLLRVSPKDREDIIKYESYKWKADRPYLPDIGGHQFQPDLKKQPPGHENKRRILPDPFAETVLSADIKKMFWMLSEEPGIVQKYFGPSKQGILSFFMTRMQASTLNRDIVRLLLLHGAPIDSVDKDGATGLYKLVEQGKTGFVVLLLLWGASVKIRPQNGPDVVALAESKGMSNLITKYTGIVERLRSGMSASPGKKAPALGTEPGFYKNTSITSVRCLLCDVTPDRNAFRHHVYLEHLPWYTWLLPANVTLLTGPRNTGMAWVMSVLMTSRKDWASIPCVKALLSQLLENLLRLLQSFLGHDLLGLALEGQNRFLALGIPGDREQLQLMKIHQENILTSRYPINIEQPDCKSAMLHWKWLGHLIQKLTLQTRQEVLNSAQYNVPICPLKADAAFIPPSELTKSKIRFKQLIDNSDLSGLCGLIESCPRMLKYAIEGSKIGKHAVAYACGGKQYLCLLVLHLYGADLNVTDNQKQAAVHHAVLVGDATGVRFLLALGADPELRGGRKGETPLSMAQKRNNKEIIRLLASHSSKS